MPERINIIGAGWSGLTTGYLLDLLGYDVHVFEQSANVGGHARSIVKDGIVCDSHGPHYFHCNDRRMWRWVTTFTPFRWFIPWALVESDVGTFHWPLTEEAVQKHPQRKQIERELDLVQMDQIAGIKGFAATSPFESSVVQRMGPTLYRTFVEGYTAKMWSSTNLDASFAPKRIPFRTDNNANYFTDRYQGVPIQGYNAIFDGLASRLTVHTKTKGSLDDAVTTIATCEPDLLFEGKYGMLPYRGLSFAFETFQQKAYKLPAPQVNNAQASVPYTRRTEPRQVTGQDADVTVVITERPNDRTRYYPMPADEARKQYRQYQEEAERQGVILTGRLGSYRYVNMNEVVDMAFETVARLTGTPVEQLWTLSTKDRAPFPSTIL